MSDVWGSEAREAVERVIHDNVPRLTRGPLGTEYVADAVLEALTPHAVPRAELEAYRLETVNTFLALQNLRAAVLALAERMFIDDARTSVWVAELRALAGGEP